MKYDFTTIMDRRGMDAMAVDSLPFVGAKVKEGFDKIPMWVADMNFATVPAVQKAMIERVNHPAFGYFYPREEYYQAIINWQEKRHGVTGLRKECIGYENGVLGGVVSALNVICSRGDKVLVHTPTYIGFTSVLKNNGYQIIHSPLYLDETGVWRMDFEDMEKRIRKEKIHAVIFCSPHNPCGRVWEKWEIEKAMEIFQKYDVTVVADEIWSDLILEDHRHIPTQSVSEDAKMRTVALYAPSKTFNLAGLIGSYHIIYNRRLRERVRKESSLSHYNSMNVLSMHALLGAYSEEGEEWVDELCQVLSENVDYACTFIKNNFPEISLAKPEGTYMILLDCKKWCESHDKTIDDVLRAGTAVGVMWQDGRDFNCPFGIRMNLALPKIRVEEAMRRLKEYVF